MKSRTEVDALLMATTKKLKELENEILFAKKSKFSEGMIAILRREQAQLRGIADTLNWVK